MNNINLISEKINDLVKSFDKMNESFLLKFNSFEQKIEQLDNKINIIENKLNIDNKIFDEPEEVKELVKEVIEIDESIALRALTYVDYRTVIIIFKEYYYNELNKNNNYPIKVTGKRSYEYFLNKKWIHDQYGHYIKHTILLNIQTLLFKYNNNDYINDYNTLVKNQDFIYKLTEEKYSKNYFRHIINEINNN